VQETRENLTWIRYPGQAAEVSLADLFMSLYLAHEQLVPLERESFGGVGRVRVSPETARCRAD
jgi:hypothetical protein